MLGGGICAYRTRFGGVSVNMLFGATVAVMGEPLMLVEEEVRRRFETALSDMIEVLDLGGTDSVLGSWWVVASLPIMETISTRYVHFGSNDPYHVVVGLLHASKVWLDQENVGTSPD